MFGIIRNWRRSRWRKRPFPPQWRPHLVEQVPFYLALNAAEKQRFEDDLKVFVWEKHFIAAGGMEITDEVRVIIAACAVRLVIALDLSYYDRLTEIVVYPYAYRHDDDDDVAILGEAHAWGTVVLSWPAVIQGLRDSRDGHDTAVHEFAHVLDGADGAFDGTPELLRRQDYRPWARILERHYFRLQDGEAPERKVLRMYGATNEAEFFAVATESFFEKGKQMAREMPELYEALKGFYGRDP